MLEIIKQASVDLNNFNDNEIVKIAGVLRRLKNWFNSLGNSDYKAQIENLKNESSIVSSYLINLNSHIELLQSAIKDVDINSYEKELSEVKFLSKQLSEELEKLNISTEKAKILENAEINTDSKNRSGYDVPLGFVNKPYKNFEHFNSIPSDAIIINQTVKDKIILNIDIKLKKLKFDIDINLFNSDNFFLILREAITNGTILENNLINDEKRPSGQMYVKVRTAPFSIPGINVKIRGVALLTDLYAQKSPKMKLSLMRFTDIEIEKLSTAKNRMKLLNKVAQNYIGPGYVKKTITNLSGQQLAQVLIDSYKKVFGQEPTLQTLGTAWAQSMFEQRGHYVNNNLGNITAGKQWIDNGGKYFVHETHNDLKNGYKEFDANGNIMQDLDHVKYRAYDSPEAGGEDYWKQLGTTFKDALAWFGTGDALHAGLALGDKTYYTANRITYSGNMASLYEEFLTKIAPNLNLVNNPTLPPSKKFPEYKAFKNSPKQQIPEKYIEKINNNAAYKIVNKNDKQFVVLNDKNNIINKNKENLSPQNDIDMEANELMKYLFAEKTLTSIVKNALMEKLLPKNQILISIASINSFSTKIKYASIVSELLEKNINAKTEILTDNNEININCIVSGENETVINAILAICDTVSDAFYFKNNSKIIKSILKSNSFSKFTSISSNDIEKHLRKYDLEEMI